MLTVMLFQPLTGLVFDLVLTEDQACPDDCDLSKGCRRHHAEFCLLVMCSPAARLLLFALDGSVGIIVDRNGEFGATSKNGISPALSTIACRLTICLSKILSCLL